MSDENTEVEIDESAIPERSWPAVVILKTPIEFPKGIFIEQLEFREGTLGDLKGIKVGKDGLTLDQLVVLAARMCGKPTQVLDRLKGKDASEVMSIVRDFMSGLTG